MSYPNNGPYRGNNVPPPPPSFGSPTLGHPAYPAPPPSVPPPPPQFRAPSLSHPPPPPIHNQWQPQPPSQHFAQPPPMPAVSAPSPVLAPPSLHSFLHSLSHTLSIPPPPPTPIITKFATLLDALLRPTSSSPSLFLSLALLRPYFTAAAHCTSQALRPPPQLPPLPLLLAQTSALHGYAPVSGSSAPQLPPAPPALASSRVTLEELCAAMLRALHQHMRSAATRATEASAPAPPPTAPAVSAPLQPSHAVSAAALFDDDDDDDDAAGPAAAPSLPKHALPKQRRVVGNAGAAPSAAAASTPAPAPAPAPAPTSTSTPAPAASADASDDPLPLLLLLALHELVSALHRLRATAPAPPLPLPALPSLLPLVTLLALDAPPARRARIAALMQLWARAAVFPAADHAALAAAAARAADAHALIADGRIHVPRPSSSSTAPPPSRAALLYTHCYDHPAPAPATGAPAEAPALCPPALHRAFVKYARARMGAHGRRVAGGSDVGLGDPAVDQVLDDAGLENVFSGQDGSSAVHGSLHLPATMPLLLSLLSATPTSPATPGPVLPYIVPQTSPSVSALETAMTKISRTQMSGTAEWDLHMDDDMYNTALMELQIEEEMAVLQAETEE